MIHIQDLHAEDTAQIEQIAQMLVESFAEHWSDAFPTIDEARQEVHESFEEARISRVALDDAGTALGWIGAQPSYSEVWELHPLVVRKDRQGQGIGRALVLDLEDQVRARGALTLMLGSDDQDDMTTLGGIDLYPNPWEHMARIQNLKGHPYTFYQKLGYAIVGVVPDANGFGKPDILMAKRLTPLR